jgi:hypothetical protein
MGLQLTDTFKIRIDIIVANMLLGIWPMQSSTKHFRDICVEGVLYPVAGYGSAVER